MKNVRAQRFFIPLFVFILSFSLQAAENPVHFARGTAEFLYADISDPGTIGEFQTVRKKSLGTAVVMSLIIPGTGELYSGRIWQGIMFLGIEAACWTAYFHYNNRGDDVDAAFREFADEHWNAASYRAWIDEYIAAHNGDSPDHFTHYLPDTKTQQYYEMIGKYDQFVNWWDDYDPNVGTRGQSARRLDYEEQRHQSNIMYDRAHLASVIAFLNHIVSAIDTIYGIKKNEYRGWTYYFDEKQLGGYPAGFFNVKYRW